jgi:hypothetical protein
METKYKPKDIPSSCLEFGIYFKSEKDISTEYFIELCEGTFAGNAIVKIYRTKILSNFFETEGLVNGSIIGLMGYNMEWIAEVNLSGKYFFPEFKNDLQLYYDAKKYYGDKNSTCSITSLMDCINYAIDYGLKESGIQPY